MYDLYLFNFLPLVVVHDIYIFNKEIYVFLFLEDCSNDVGTHSMSIVI